MINNDEWYKCWNNKTKGWPKTRKRTSRTALTPKFRSNDSQTYTLTRCRSNFPWEDAPSMRHGVPWGHVLDCGCGCDYDCGSQGYLNETYPYRNKMINHPVVVDVVAESFVSFYTENPWTCLVRHVERVAIHRTKQLLTIKQSWEQIS